MKGAGGTQSSVAVAQTVSRPHGPGWRLAPQWEVMGLYGEHCRVPLPHSALASM